MSIYWAISCSERLEAGVTICREGFSNVALFRHIKNGSLPLFDKTDVHLFPSMWLNLFNAVEMIQTPDAVVVNTYRQWMSKSKDAFQHLWSTQFLIVLFVIGAL